MYSRYEAATRDARWVQGRYKGCKAGTRQLQEVCGRYEAATMGVRWARGSYKEWKGGMRQL